MTHICSIVYLQIEQWLAVQNMWMYVEAVFSGGDIVKQLPTEAKRFQNIDKSFMKVCFYAYDTLNTFILHIRAPQALQSET